MKSLVPARCASVGALVALCSLTPSAVVAHCDTLDGPVVAAARHAIASSNLNPVLIWVRTGDEGEIRQAFENTLRVRLLSPQAAALADTYFFETVVRIHRAGEGAPYSGLKPAEHDGAGAIAAADEALNSGNVEPLVKLLTEKLEHSVRGHFAEALARKNFRTNDVPAGRAFVKAYVEYTHRVEALEQAASGQHDDHSAPPRHDQPVHNNTAHTLPHPAMAGHWKGSARIIVAWCQQTTLPVSITIHGDGTVAGTIGDAALKQARLKPNRGWLGRKLHLKTDYIVVGKLEGAIVAREHISRSGVSIPLNFTGTNFVGGVHTSGTHVGGKKHMVLSASSLTLVRSNLP